MSSSHQESRVVLVTGASRGLGDAIVRHLDQLGIRTVMVARSEVPLRELERELNHAIAYPLDLSEPLRSHLAVQACLDSFGRLDALINNAGVIEPTEPLIQADPMQWLQAITINLTAPAMLMRAALPQLKERRGRVVNISSGAAVKTVKAWSAYCTSKAGLLHLTRVAAEETPEVAFFSLRPGVIDTEMQTQIRSSTGMAPDDLDKFRDLKSSGKLEPPDVPAKAAVWLALYGPHARSGDFIEYTDPDILKGLEKLTPTVSPAGT